METNLILFSIFLYMVLVYSQMLKPVIASAQEFNYCDALGKSLLFFEAQRSGYLPSNHTVYWRNSSGLHDGFAQEVDLVGGYYDAGDHIKFGFPMAFAMTMISWSVIEFEREIYICNQLEKALDAIQWGTDYLIKAHTQANVLWSQVGDGYSDHKCWERAEDMTTSRTAYKVDSEHPGSDIAGETAAAMAAASIVFKKYDFAYSEILLSHSKQLFSFADTYQGRYDDFVSDSRDFYPSMGFHDELFWAAAWLFKATNEEYYINYIMNKVASIDETEFDVTQFSWENKYAGLEVLLVKMLTYHGNEAYNQTLDRLRAKAEFFLCACVQKNDKENVAMSPGGLLYFKEWSNMLCVSSSAFLLTVYSEYLYTGNSTLNCFIGQVQPVELLKFAQSQANYMLGKNPNSMSYLVGYQSNFPTHVHHRGASIPSVSVLSVPVGCFEGYNKWYLRNESNPNVIVGALVGGPNFNDKFDDQRSNYAQNEPTLAGNAPLIGLFARMNRISRSSGEASYGHYAHFYVPVVTFWKILKYLHLHIRGITMRDWCNPQLLAL